MATIITTVDGNGKYRAIVEQDANGVNLRIVTSDGTGMVIFKFPSIKDVLLLQHDIGAALIDSTSVPKAA